MAERSIRLSRRNIDALIMAMALPVMLLLIFVYFFGGAIDTGTRYVTYVVPGVLLLCAGFGSAGTAVAVTEDLKGGIIDRFRSLDVGATAILTGHVLASTARNLIATSLVFALGPVRSCDQSCSRTGRTLSWRDVNSTMASGS